MTGFAAACDEVGATASKLAKIERLATYFVALEDDDLRAAARFLTGRPLAAGDDRKVAIGGRTILSAARTVFGFSDAELRAAYRDTGDLGEALARLFGSHATPALFAETLTPASFADLLDELAGAEGKAAGKRREAGAERALRACTTARELAYVAKILTGDLRIGLKEALVLDALARAFEREPDAVRSAAMAAGDAGAVAVAARHGTLDRLEIRYGAPIGLMLATPVAFGSSYRDLDGARWLAEDKYDGIRAQAHVRQGRVSLYSRNFRDLSRAFPDVVAALQGLPADAIFDGEIVARRDGRVLPFRYLQTRLQRVDPAPELIEEIPAQLVVFDALAAGARFLLDATLAQRRLAMGTLFEALSPSPALALAPAEAFDARDGVDAPALERLFDGARERGNEGLMLKREDSPYAPGRRGKWWLKLKRELATIDAVVVAVEWGHGKRAKVLSDYTFAVRASADDPALLTIGKAYTGLTDVEIAEMTEWFLAHKLGAQTSRTIAVAPEIVVEIAFDIVQKSTLHDSGFSLRFPRIARLRSDKSAADIDTLDAVKAVYEDMLARERVEH
jgi:DNA ligase-1